MALHYNTASETQMGLTKLPSAACVGRGVALKRFAANRLTGRRHGCETTMVSFMKKSIRRTKVAVAALTVVTFVVRALEEQPTSQSNTHPKEQ